MMTDSELEGKRRYKTLTRSLTFVVIFSPLLKCGAAEDIPIVNADMDTYLSRAEKIIAIAFGILSIVAIFVAWKLNCFCCQSNPQANPQANQENCGRDNRNDRPIIVHGDYNMHQERAFRVDRDYNENVTNHNNRIVAIPMEQLELSRIGPSRSPLPLTN